MHIKSILVIGVLFLTAAGSALADTDITAEIPFEFMLGNKVMPAGVYSITYDPAQSQAVLKLNCRRSHVSATTRFTAVKQTGDNEQLKLTFNRYGERYFLSQAWMGTVVREVPRSRAEGELIARTAKPDKISILAGAR